MKTAIAIRHVDFEDLGTLESPLRERGYAIRYIDAPVDDLAALDTEAPDLLVVLGAPIGACDEEVYPFLAGELDAVRGRLDTGKPILGICLGAQLIARALGARVYPLGVKEIGYGPLTMTAEGLKSPLAAIGETPVLHWHGDQFDIPAGAVRLASTPVGENQAFAVGRDVLGLQFHLEVDAHQIERWLVGHTCELAQAGIDPRTLRAQAWQNHGRSALVAHDVIGAWLDGFETSCGTSPS